VKEIKLLNNEKRVLEANIQMLINEKRDNLEANVNIDKVDKEE